MFGLNPRQSNQFQCSNCNKKLTIPRIELTRAAAPRCKHCGATGLIQLPPAKVKPPKPKPKPIEDFEVLRRLCGASRVKMPAKVKKEAKKCRLRMALAKAGNPNCAKCPKPAKAIEDGVFLCGLHGHEHREAKRKAKRHG